MQLRRDAQPTLLQGDDDYLLLERDLLDQQIIDVDGHKVVRVNDVDLVWENCQEEPPNLTLRIAEVEVGMRGAVRRLLKGLPATSVDRIASRFSASVIPWDFVDLIERDPSRRVRLKIEQDRLSKMHPSDIADILEELAPAERHALFISLDEEVAAEALEEVKPKMQQSLIESLDSEQIAGIVEEMDPGAAADLLSELTDERSEAILEEMDPEERQEVEDLLEFSGDSAAGRMTTEYLALPATALVDRAIEALREYEGDIENITDVFLLDEEEKIIAMVPLVQLLLAAAGTPLADLPRRPHRHLQRRRKRTKGGRALRQIQSAVPAGDRSRETARRRHPCRTGHCSFEGEPLEQTAGKRKGNAVLHEDSVRYRPLTERYLPLSPLGVGAPRPPGHSVQRLRLRVQKRDLSQSKPASGHGTLRGAPQQRSDQNRSGRKTRHPLDG